MSDMDSSEDFNENDINLDKIITGNNTTDNLTAFYNNMTFDHVNIHNNISSADSSNKNNDRTNSKITKEDKIVKKNLSQLQKYHIVTLVQSKIDNQTNSMPKNGWLSIAAKYDKSVKTIKNIWNEYKTQVSMNVNDEDMLKPKEKGKADKSKLDEYKTNLIKQIMLEYNYNISYRQLKYKLETEYHIKLGLSTLFQYCKLIKSLDGQFNNNIITQNNMTNNIIDDIQGTKRVKYNNIK